VAQSLCFQHSGAVVEANAARGEVFAALAFEAHAGEQLIATQFARVATSLETDDPVAVASAHTVTHAVALAEHVQACEALWETDIEIEGDEETQQFTRAALFYLWNSVRENDTWSIAPMGLSGNFYNGHIFWDAELWMYPTLLVTHPALGKSCVAYRERTLPAARERAASNGYAGAQFPWEGGYTGVEMTPPWAETRDFQLHVTADVAIGQWWYYLVTGDVDWLRDHGYPVIRACAEYWVSRVEYNADADRYEVSNVVCADEYAEHVDNDAFTNASVHEALMIAVRAAEILGELAPPQWREVARKMYVPYDDEAHRHVEFDGYAGQRTKQADVELLAYPLEYTVDREQIARDLDYYGSVIDPHGPAMSFSVYSILSAQLGRASEAYQFLLKSFVPNTTRPFWSFSETPTNNEYFFCTGAGGAVQALLFGFSGLRLREDHISIGPILPPNWSALRLHNLFVQGARTDIELEPRRTQVCRHTSTGDVGVTIDWDDRSIRFDWDGDGAGGQMRWVTPEGQGGESLIARPGQRVPIPGSLDDFRVRLTVDRGPAPVDLHVRRPAP
jgi:trehalose/maltose hydrolase-like predicted phosphorylase